MKTWPRKRQTLTFSAEINGDNCQCEFCKRNKSFEAPSELLDAFLDGSVLLFAGAGISTEAPGVMPNTLYSEINYILGGTTHDRAFPDLMEDFCSSPSGKIGLIQKIKEHFDYAYSHGQIYRNATRFHRELATFFPLDTVVTTNWDDYFEQHCAATPFIEDRDLGLWAAAERKVIKIHGSISNFGSIVATRSDYKACETRLQIGLLGAHLKSLLATRNVVFIGYSLRDDDFLQIYGGVLDALRDFRRQAYFVAPNISASDRQRLSELNLNLIETDGTFFVEQIKAHATTKICLCSDVMYEEVEGILALTRRAHSWLHDTYNAIKYPQILFCSWYQDGMLHALERILRLRKTGIYSDRHRLIGSFRSYHAYAEQYRKIRNYSDSAYCYGYANAYLYASLDDKERSELTPPIFFYFDCEIETAAKYKRALKRLPELHKSAFKYAQRIAARHPHLETHVLDHKDQLDLSQIYPFNKLDSAD
ncbi:hypothetical protein CWO90_46550 [Bradyrhizobium sp. Leo121]|nr:hypothetical protein CWO90_46550 [Bradyrhizobium sp. Leo121]